MSYAQPERVAALPPRRPRRLVIADDSAGMRQFVRSAVGPAFDEVLEVCDGRELLWALLRARFAGDPSEVVLITDVAMPGYSGLDVLDAWRDELGDLPTIVMTAFPSDHIQARAALLGVTLLPKPFSLVRLRRVVQDVFQVPVVLTP